MSFDKSEEELENEFKSESDYKETEEEVQDAINRDDPNFQYSKEGRTEDLMRSFDELNGHQH